MTARILVIDDDPDLVEVLRLTLEANGYEVYSAAGGAEGLEQVKAAQPDLIILDELFSGLSLAEVASIVPIIEKLRLAGKTIIMIEHRLKELFRIADRVIVLNYGDKIAEGNADEVMESDAVKKAYLGAEA